MFFRIYCRWCDVGAQVKVLAFKPQESDVT